MKTFISKSKMNSEFIITVINLLMMSYSKINRGCWGIEKNCPTTTMPNWPCEVFNATRIDSFGFTICDGGFAKYITLGLCHDHANGSTPIPGQSSLGVLFTKTWEIPWNPSINPGKPWRLSCKSHATFTRRLYKILIASECSETDPRANVYRETSINLREHIKSAISYVNNWNHRTHFKITTFLNIVQNKVQGWESLCWGVGRFP